MDIVKSHGMTPQQARETIDGLLPKMMRMYGGSVADPAAEWRGDALLFSGGVMGLDIRGAVRITDEDLLLRLDGIPFFAGGTVRKRLDRWFDENWPRMRSGEDNA